MYSEKIVNTIPITRMITRLDRPNALITTTPVTTSGIARNASTKRLMTSSVTPRKYPMTRPTALPEARRKWAQST